MERLKRQGFTYKTMQDWTFANDNGSCPQTVSYTHLDVYKRQVLDSEAKKGCHFFQTAGKTQLPKRLIVGKDRAAGKVLAGKSVIFAFCGVVGSKGRTPARSLL